MLASPAVGAGAGMAAPLRPTDARTHRDQHMCTRDIHTCMLSAGTDKTRANEGEKFWQREAEEGAMHRVEKVLHKRKSKAAGDKAEQKKGGEGGGSGEKGSCRDIAVQSNTCRCRGCRRDSRRSQSGARIVGRSSRRSRCRSSARARHKENHRSGGSRPAARTLGRVDGETTQTAAARPPPRTVPKFRRGEH